MHPAKAIGRNEMSFGSDIHVVPSNIVLDRGPRPPVSPPERRYGCQSPSQNLHCLWLLLTAYRNSATPCPMVPSPTPCDFPSPQITCFQSFCLVPSDFGLCYGSSFVVVVVAVVIVCCVTVSSNVLTAVFHCFQHHK